MADMILNFYGDLAAYVLLMLALEFGAHRWVRRRAGLSISWRRHVAVLLLIAASVAVAALAGHWERERLRNSVSNLAPTYADELMRLGHEKINAHTAPDDPAYLAMIEAEKRWLRSNPTVADIYTFGRNDAGQIVLLVDSETDYNHNGIFDGEREQRTPIGEVYDEDTDDINRAFAGNNVWMDTPTTDRWGTGVSCFVPLRDSRGSVTAVLGVDYPADDWVQSILLARGGILGLSLIATLIVLATQMWGTLGRFETDTPTEAPAAADDGGEGWRPMLRRARPAVFVIVASMVATFFAREIVLKDSMTVARHQFEADWHDHFQIVQGRVENLFTLTSDALRTIASLPGVRHIGPHGEGFSDDSRQTVQALFDNIALHAAVSDVHIVPAGLDPDADPAGDTPTAPIATFEKPPGKNADDKAAGSDGGGLEAAETREYRAMREQLAWCRAHAATSGSFQAAGRPALMSREFVTADSSEMTPRDVAVHNDEPRLGFVYSVPFYDQDGSLLGLVSAVIRTRSVARLLGSPEFALHSDDLGYTIRGGAMNDDGLPPALDIRDETQTHDQSAWVLSCTVPRAEFARHAMVEAAEARANLVTFSGISISLPLAGLLLSILATRRRALKLANRMTRELRLSEAHIRAVIHGALDAVVKCDEHGNVVTWNPQATRMFGWTENEILHRPLFATLFSARQAGDEQRAMLARLIDAGTPSEERIELMAIDQAGREFHVEVAIAPMEQAGASVCAFIRDISEAKKAAAERDALHAQLVDASRRAGMADVATGVLHNVGNVLNSVNVAAGILADRVHSPEVAELVEAVGLLQAHKADLADYLTRDASGMNVPDYVVALAQCVQVQHQEVTQELQQLSLGIEHIKEIVASQQSVAKAGAVVQEVLPADLVRDALALSAGAVGGIAPDIVADVRIARRIPLDRHKLLQVLVNLIRNAKQAILEGKTAKGIITITVKLDDEGKAVLWQVQDTGMGIAPDNLEKIFRHGFTTRKDGHGFGLHSCANAAAEMGGALHVQSDGVGRGALFTLEIPLLQPAEDRP